METIVFRAGAALSERASVSRRRTRTSSALVIQRKLVIKCRAVSKKAKTFGRESLRLRYDPVEDGLLDVETVLGLIENGLGVGFERGFVDFLAAISGQAVHDERIRFGPFD